MEGVRVCQQPSADISAHKSVIHHEPGNRFQRSLTMQVVAVVVAVAVVSLLLLLLCLRFSDKEIAFGDFYGLQRSQSDGWELLSALYYTVLYCLLVSELQG
ncbi:hypothetical protein CBL_13726 [Carabus blaptoides fortunei]